MFAKRLFETGCDSIISASAGDILHGDINRLSLWQIIKSKGVSTWMGQSGYRKLYTQVG